MRQTVAFVVLCALCVPAITRADMTVIEGVVRPSKQVVLNAPIETRLAEVLVVEDQTVKKDDLLARMDDGIQKVAVEAAKTKAESLLEVEKTRLVMEEAQITLDRVKEAFSKGAASDFEVRKSKLDVDQARVDHEQAQTNHALEGISLRIEEEKLKRYELRAPFDGRVVRIEAEAGATLTTNDRVMGIAALDPLEAYVFVPAGLVGKLKVGDKVTLRPPDYTGGDLSGEVKTIDAMQDTASETVRVVFTIPNPDQKLRAGFKVRLVMDVKR
ncbi:MAG: efflux RND transporter periplasmic adaptor subunit [Phycisphaera sp.]|nr:efflux RND transporter periplasmic adaptor subunit [Phycisphaera sp.]